MQIISLYGLSVNDDKQEIYFILEEMEADLSNIIKYSKHKLAEDHIKCLSKQLLEGIKAMHGIGIIHRDIKPANILVNQQCQLRLTDFGLSRYYEPNVKPSAQNPLSEYVITRWYRAPEVLLSPSFQYSTAVDLWSVGCVIAELFHRKPIFPGDGHVKQVQLIFDAIAMHDIEDIGFPLSASKIKFLNRITNTTGASFYRWFPGISVEGAALLESLLVINPSKRATAASALEMPFFDDVVTLYDYSTYKSKVVASDYLAFDKGDYDVSELASLVREEIKSFVEVDDDIIVVPSSSDGDEVKDEEPPAILHLETLTAKKPDLNKEKGAENPIQQVGVSEKKSDHNKEYEITILPNGSIAEENGSMKATAITSPKSESKPPSTNPFRSQRPPSSYLPSIAATPTLPERPSSSNSSSNLLPKIRSTVASSGIASGGENSRAIYRHSRDSRRERTLTTSTMLERFSIEPEYASKSGIDNRDTITGRASKRPQYLPSNSTYRDEEEKAISSSTPSGKVTLPELTCKTSSKMNSSNKYTGNSLHMAINQANQNDSGQSINPEISNHTKSVGNNNESTPNSMNTSNNNNNNGHLSNFLAASSKANINSSSTKLFSSISESAKQKTATIVDYCAEHFDWRNMIGNHHANNQAIKK